MTYILHRSFLTSQGLPPYVATSRLIDFEPRSTSSTARRTPTIQLVRGGTFLWNLTGDPTTLDLVYSTAGTTVVPELGR